MRKAVRRLIDHLTGSLRLANTAEELRAYKSLQPVHKNIDAAYHIVGPREINAIHALAKAAKMGGAAVTHVQPRYTSPDIINAPCPLTFTPVIASGAPRTSTSANPARPTPCPCSALNVGWSISPCAHR